MFLRNHGALAVGETIADAWLWIHRLEWACRYQVDAVACVGAGLTVQRLSDAAIARTTAQAREAPSGIVNPAPVTDAWASLLRRLERERGPGAA
jgi:ribulose-5-phosphate 4-epimerase/fuculose-1-phosphate aldolase